MQRRVRRSVAVALAVALTCTGKSASAAGPDLSVIAQAWWNQACNAAEVASLHQRLGDAKADGADALAAVDEDYRELGAVLTVETPSLYDTWQAATAPVPDESSIVRLATFAQCFGLPEEVPARDVIDLIKSWIGITPDLPPNSVTTIVLFLLTNPQVVTGAIVVGKPDPVVDEAALAPADPAYEGVHSTAEDLAYSVSVAGTGAASAKPRCRYEEPQDGDEFRGGLYIEGQMDPSYGDKFGVWLRAEYWYNREAMCTKFGVSEWASYDGSSTMFSRWKFTDWSYYDGTTYTFRGQPRGGTRFRVKAQFSYALWAPVWGDIHTMEAYPWAHLYGHYNGNTCVDSSSPEMRMGENVYHCAY